MEEQVSIMKFAANTIAELAGGKAHENEMLQKTLFLKNSAICRSSALACLMSKFVDVVKFR